MAYETAMRQLARQLIAEHGDLVEVRCVAKPSRIELVFADGHEIVVGEHSGRVDISMMKFGYDGTGSRCFHAFLDEAGFSVTYEEVTQVEGGTTLTRSESSMASPEESVEPGEWFSMDVEDVFSIKGRGTVVTGTVRTGVVKPGDEVEIVGSDERLRTTVTALEMFRKALPMVRAGEKVGVLLQDIRREQVKRGMVLQSPGLEPTPMMKEIRELARSAADDRLVKLARIASQAVSTNDFDTFSTIRSELRTHVDIDRFIHAIRTHLSESEQVAILNALQGDNGAKDIEGDQDITKRCAHCGSKFYEPKTMMDKVDFDAMQRVRVGCSKCGTAVCFSCAATAADQRGKEGNCFCPKCGAELGRGGEAGELGEHFSGWD